MTIFNAVDIERALAHMRAAQVRYVIEQKMKLPTDQHRHPYTIRDTETGKIIWSRESSSPFPERDTAYQAAAQKFMELYLTAALDAAVVSVKSRGAARDGVTVEQDGRWFTNDAEGVNNLTGQFPTLIIKQEPPSADT